MNYLFSGEISWGGWREDSSCRGCGMQLAILGIFWLVFSLNIVCSLAL